MMTANMKIEQLPPHIQNKKEVLKLIRKFEKTKNYYLGLVLEQLLGWEADYKTYHE